MDQKKKTMVVVVAVESSRRTDLESGKLPANRFRLWRTPDEQI